MNMDLEKRKKRIELFAKIGGALAVGFLVQPFIYAAIGGVLALGASVIVGLIAVNLTPWFGLKLANWRLRALKAEAAANPIPSLENTYQSELVRVQYLRNSIQSFAGSFRMFKEKIDGVKKQYPAEAKKFDDEYQNMAKLLQFRKDKYEEAKDYLVEFEREIDKAKIMWDLAQSAAEMNKLAGVDTDAFNKKLITETALDSIQKNLSIQLSELELSVLDEKGGRAPVQVTNSDEMKQVGDKPKTLDLEIESDLLTVGN